MDEILPLPDEEDIEEEEEEEETSVPVYYITDTPRVDKAFHFTTLSKLDAKGARRFWSVGYNGINDLVIRTWQSVERVRTVTRVVTPMASRAMIDQVVQEAAHRYQKKYRAGYRPEIHMKLEYPGAMLCERYYPDVTAISAWPIAMQPKLDGIRVLGHPSRTGVVLMTRSGKRYTHLPFIAGLIDDFMGFLPPGCSVDGELYIHGETFNQIQSIVTTTTSIHPKLDQLEYHLFDVIPNMHTPFETRWGILLTAFTRYIMSTESTTLKLVPVSLAYDKSELLSFHQLYTSAGYEGSILRKVAGRDPTEAEVISASYCGRRCSNILKYKDYDDEEVDVTGVEDCQGTEAGCAKLVCLDVRGNELSVRMTGSFDRRREWLLHPDLVVGKRLTIIYQGLSVDGVPRFPIGKSIREAE